MTELDQQSTDRNAGSEPGWDRRDFVRMGGLGTAALALGATGAPAGAAPAGAAGGDGGPLRFRPDGTFRIVQFNDTQDDERIDRCTLECPGPFNSGMFSAILDRGDVKGVFCGHDHVDTYVGDYYGVLLGYSGNTGFGTYGLSGAERNRLRGARVFELTERDGEVDSETRMVFAADLGRT